MILHLLLFLLLSLLILYLARLCHLYLLHPCLPRSRAGAVHPMVHRLLKPRDPGDCPACRLSSTFSVGVVASPVPTTSARTLESQTLTFMPWLGMASMVMLSRSKRFAARPATPLSLLGATPL